MEEEWCLTGTASRLGLGTSVLFPKIFILKL